MTFIEYLNHRTEYEKLVSGFVLPNDKYHGTIQSMKWFVKKGYTANRFRKGFNEALEVCQKVIDEYRQGSN